MENTEKTRTELARQRTILARQLEQYRTARPRARFAYAAHITKTKGKIARLESELDAWSPPAHYAASFVEAARDAGARDRARALYERGDILRDRTDKDGRPVVKYQYAKDVDSVLISRIATELEESNAKWERGEAASPSELDFVLIADRLLTERHPLYIGSTPEGREFVADVIHDHTSAGALQTYDELATAIVDQLVAE